MSKVATWLAVGATSAFAVLAIAAYRPGGSGDREQSVQMLKSAVRELSSTETLTSHRLTTYRDALSAAQSQLQRAVTDYPVDSATLARLAAVRWELSGVGSGPVAPSISDLVVIAAGRAPRDPQVHVELGGLLYKMGQSDEAAEALSRAVTLSPSMTNRVVSLMLDTGLSPREVTQILPEHDRVLIALAASPALISSDGDWYLRAVESRLADSTPELLATYGESCLQLREAARLRRVLAELPPTTNVPVRVERAVQTAHASLSLGEPESALLALESVRDLLAGNARRQELYGEVLLACGRSHDGETAIRRAIELELAGEANQIRRARQYEALGRALELQGRPEVAYDAFRRAVALDPNLAAAARRVANYERGAMTTVR